MNTLELIGLVVLHALWQGAIVGGSFLIGSWFVGKNNPLARYRLAGVHLLWLLGWVGNTLWQQLPGTSGTSSDSTVLYGITQADILAFLQGGTDRSMDWVDTLSPWLGWIWIAGVMILSVRLLGGIWYVRQLRKQAISSPFDEWQKMTDEFASRLGISREVKLAFSRKVSQPMTLGLFRPIILLPVELMTGLPMADLDMVLAHELAHIRRADYLINVLQNVLEIAFFFHPVVWWISRDMRRSREACCDDLAVGITGDAIRYAQTLTRLQRLFISQKTFLPMTYLASPATLRLRVERLFVAKSTASPLLILPALAFIAGLMLLHPWNNPQLAQSIQATASSLFQPAVQPSGIVPNNLQPTTAAVVVATPETQAQPTPPDAAQAVVFLSEVEERGHIFYFLNTHTKEDLDQLKADMAAKGITLEVFNVNFNDGLITSLGVKVKTEKTSGTFNIEPFKILIVEVSEDLSNINFTTNPPPPPPAPTMPVVPGSRVNDAPPPPPPTMPVVVPGRRVNDAPPPPPPAPAPAHPVIDGSRVQGTVAPPSPPLPSPTPTPAPNSERAYPIPPPPPPVHAPKGEGTFIPSGDQEAYIIVDGVALSEGEKFDMNEEKIAEISVLNRESAIEKYGERAANGAIEITTKKTGLFGRNRNSGSSGELEFNVRGSAQPLFELDGEIVSKQTVESLSPDDIFEVVVIKPTDDDEGNQSLFDQYGEAGKNGVVLVRTKKAALVEGDVREVMTISSQDPPIFFVNGERVAENTVESINPDDIASINVLKGDAAVDKYGEAGRNGVVEITMK